MKANFRGLKHYPEYKENPFLKKGIDAPHHTRAAVRVFMSCKILEMGLSPYMFRVLMYILNTKSKNCDYFYFSANECAVELGDLTRSNVYLVLSRFLEKGIIARSDDKYKFFINLSLFKNA